MKDRATRERSSNVKRLDRSVARRANPAKTSLEAPS